MASSKADLTPPPQGLDLGGSGTPASALALAACFAPVSSIGGPPLYHSHSTSVATKHALRACGRVGTEGTHTHIISHVRGNRTETRVVSHARQHSLCPHRVASHTPRITSWNGSKHGTRVSPPFSHLDLHGRFVSSTSTERPQSLHPAPQLALCLPPSLLRLQVVRECHHASRRAKGRVRQPCGIEPLGLCKQFCITGLVCEDLLARCHALRVQSTHSGLHRAPHALATLPRPCCALDSHSGVVPSRGAPGCGTASTSTYTACTRSEVRGGGGGGGGDGEVVGNLAAAYRKKNQTAVPSCPFAHCLLTERPLNHSGRHGTSPTKHPTQPIQLRAPVHRSRHCHS